MLNRIVSRLPRWAVPVAVCTLLCGTIWLFVRLDGIEASRTVQNGAVTTKDEIRAHFRPVSGHH